MKSRRFERAAAIALFAALVLATSWTTAFASQRTFGLPPRVGAYVSTGVGSGLAVERAGSHYSVHGFRLRMPSDCGAVGGRMATISRSLKLSKVVRHRVGENEVSYEFARFKGFRASGHGNVWVSVEDQRFAGNLDLSFIRGISGFKPMRGDLDLGPLEGEDCDAIFSGHQR